MLFTLKSEVSQDKHNVENRFSNASRACALMLEAFQNTKPARANYDDSDSFIADLTHWSKSLAALMQIDSDMNDGHARASAIKIIDKVATTQKTMRGSYQNKLRKVAR